MLDYILFVVGNAVEEIHTSLLKKTVHNDTLLAVKEDPPEGVDYVCGR